MPGDVKKVASNANIMILLRGRVERKPQGRLGPSAVTNGSCFFPSESHASGPRRRVDAPPSVVSFYKRLCLFLSDASEPFLAWLCWVGVPQTRGGVSQLEWVCQARSN